MQIFASAHSHDFYINGAWSSCATGLSRSVENPATETTIGTIALGGAEDVDSAVRAAIKAFESFAWSSTQDRVTLLEAVLAGFKKRGEELAHTMTVEMGAPISFARDGQLWAAIATLESTIESLKRYDFQLKRGSTRVVMEPIGVCGLITPWNWPLLQIVCKVAPAISAGCTIVLKPSELSPLSALIFAEIMHEAGTPPGVFNLVNGSGENVGAAIAAHPGIDAVSFTGSVRGGIAVAKQAADTVKRVTQELGGKSANIILPDADLQSAVTLGVESCFSNSGQNCNAPSRMLVSHSRLEEVVEIAAECAKSQIVGDPQNVRTQLGPVANRNQFAKVQRMIHQGQSEGAHLVSGGPGRYEGMDRGYFVRPTVFANVTPDMTIAKEEIFGPVLCIMSYRDEAHAIDMANNTPYGLGARIASKDVDRARQIASRLRAGTITINYAAWDTAAPFGGYKQSGNGRENGEFGITEYLQPKAIIGFGERVGSSSS